jgi:asparagine synthase (glutamine-hydrolysing)
MLYADTRTYLHELLMKQDQMSMAASIESRVPFLDHELASWVAALPERYKLHGWSTKHILRRAMKDTLPPVILSRKKMGFPVPIGAWLRGRWRFLLDEFVLSDRVLSRGFFEPSVVKSYVEEHDRSGTHGSRLWALLNFEVWYRGAFEGEGATELSRLMVPTAVA